MCHSELVLRNASARFFAGLPALPLLKTPRRAAPFRRCPAAKSLERVAKLHRRYFRDPLLIQNSKFLIPNSLIAPAGDGARRPLRLSYCWSVSTYVRRL